MRHRPPLALVALLASAACGDARSGDPGSSAGDPALAEAHDLVAGAADTGWRVAPTATVEIGVLEGQDEYQLQRVGDAARQSDGGIVIADAGRGTVRLFRPDGVFERTLGGPGAAPGEFEEPSQLLVDAHDSVFVWDASAWRRTGFDADGNLGPVHGLATQLVSRASEPPLYPVDVRIVPGERLLVLKEEKGTKAAPAGPSAETPGQAWLTDLSIASLERLASYVASERVMVDSPWGGEIAVEPPLGRTTVVAVQPNEARLCIGDRSAREVRCFGSEGDEAIVAWQGAERRLSDDDPDVRAWRADMMELYGQKLPEKDARRFVESIPLPEARPPFVAMSLDTEGMLWVDLGLAEGGQRRDFVVFDRDGALTGTVSMPAIRVLEIGRDYVLGVREDELDVQYVGVYPLERGG